MSRSASALIDGLVELSSAEFKLDSAVYRDSSIHRLEVARGLFVVKAREEIR